MKAKFNFYNDFFKKIGVFFGFFISFSIFSIIVYSISSFTGILPADWNIFYITIGLFLYLLVSYFLKIILHCDENFFKRS